MTSPDIRQSPEYAQFMTDLGWKVEKIGLSFAYIRTFPFLGSFVKIQRISTLIPFEEIEKLRKKYQVKKLVITPLLTSLPVMVGESFTRFGYRMDTQPSTPTKTIHIDLRPSYRTIFATFTPEKRRAVRRAIKHQIRVVPSQNIQEFARLKRKQNGILGFLLTKEIITLWKNFRNKKAVLLLAYKDDVLLSGVLLLFHGKTAYYWYAVSTSLGKKLFAPTLLANDAIKTAKKRGATVFEFEGIYDARYPIVTSSWKGFSKFKSGFGGKEIEYVGSFKK